MCMAGKSGSGWGRRGGQFSIFFPPGGKFELADWQTPAVIDTEGVCGGGREARGAVSFRHEARLTNYSRGPSSPCGLSGTSSW